MKTLIQRVSQASVSVNGETVGAIDKGLLLLVGIEKHDTEDTLERMAHKVCAYRVFPDADGKMNLSVYDVGGAILAVSQFPLAADTKKGLRPGFSVAAPPQQAEILFDLFVEKLNSKVSKIERGAFGADMQVSLINDGPVTFLLEM